MPVSCECIWGLPLNDKLDAIYCEFYANATDTVDLPTCQFVKGMNLMDKISAIYCAILAGGSGGVIDPSDIEGATPYGISLLQLPAPQASALISSDGATAIVLDPTDSITQNIAFAQISDASMFLTAIQNASDPFASAIFSWEAGPNVITFLSPAGTGQFINNNSPAFTGNLTPPLSLDIVNGSINTGS